MRRILELVDVGWSHVVAAWAVGSASVEVWRIEPWISWREIVAIALAIVIWRSGAYESLGGDTHVIVSLLAH